MQARHPSIVPDRFRKPAVIYWIILIGVVFIFPELVQAKTVRVLQVKRDCLPGGQMVASATVRNHPIVAWRRSYTIMVCGAMNVCRKQTIYNFDFKCGGAIYSLLQAVVASIPERRLYQRGFRFYNGVLYANRIPDRGTVVPNFAGHRASWNPLHAGDAPLMIDLGGNAWVRDIRVRTPISEPSRPRKEAQPREDKSTKIRESRKSIGYDSNRVVPKVRNKDSALVPILVFCLLVTLFILWWVVGYDLTRPVRMATYFFSSIGLFGLLYLAGFRDYDVLASVPLFGGLALALILMKSNII